MHARKRVLILLYKSIYAGEGVRVSFFFSFNVYRIVVLKICPLKWRNRLEEILNEIEKPEAARRKRGSEGQEEEEEEGREEDVRAAEKDTEAEAATMRRDESV